MAYRNLRLKTALNRAGQLIAPTHFVRQTYQELGIDSKKISVIPHGIRPPEAMHHAKRQEGDPLRVVYIGGLSPQKGVHILVEAVNSLAPDSVRLNIFGDMTAFPEYSAALQRQARHHNIHFGGRLPHESLWNVLGESDLLVVPSLWYETASLIIQEAFAAGVPVLTSDIGALRERVRNDIDGRLFPAGDAAVLSAMLEDFFHHPEKLAKLAAQIQPVFTIDQHQQAVDKIYQLVLAQPSAV
jgi:glycosyltransferase involved in cell wall biosynthesis